LLAILDSAQDQTSTQLQTRETLANLGWHGPLKSSGIRILSIDGGGMRGIIALQMLKALEQETGQEIHQLFDFICGVSTGAIIASFLGFHKKTIPEIEQTYKVPHKVSGLGANKKLF
jgi:calcium-independent phospholipase A2-gamma